MGDIFMCTRCCRQYPTIRTVWCRQTTIIGGLCLCVTCHRILHGSSCRSHRPPGHHKHNLMCHICGEKRAELACPLCLTKSDDLTVTSTLCEDCNNSYHVDHKALHLDHVFTLPLE